MSLKRPLNSLDSPGSSSSSPPPRSRPSKRRHLSPVLTCPFPSSLPAIDTPRTPSRRHYPIPFDSPNNPFGRKHSLDLALPRATSFGKHLPLRFQLIRDGVRGTNKDGVYRIVQVPLNYSFRHLHKLLLFLFGGHPVSSKDVPPRRSTRRTSGKGKATQRENQGHIFEVQKHVSMYNEAYKPGQIRSGRTRVKLSSVRDPYRYRGEDDFAGYGIGGDVQVGETDAEGEGEEWRWETEEDFMVSHTWPDGVDPSRGIIYHHDSHTQVHITVNRIPLPARKGVGNKPFVFRAHGLVHLRSDNEQGETREDRPELVLIPEHWNTHDAFDGFLKRSNARERAKREEDMDGDLANISMYPAMSDDLSGISDLTTPGLDSSTSDSSFSVSSSPFLFTPITPFPRHPVHALRVEHAHRQMVKLTKKGMEGLVFESDEDEEEEVDELTGREDEDGGEAVDQLTEEGCEAEHDMGERLEFRRRGLDWDPFGDEVEL